MTTRYILALVILLAVIVGLQMSGVFRIAGNIYREWSLKNVERGDVKALKWSREYLDSDEIQIRAAAASSIGRIGQADQATLADLIQKVDNDVPRVASSAAWSLGHIELMEPEGNRTAYQSEVVAALIRGLSHQDKEVRRYAAYALSNYGMRGIDASPAIPALVAKLKDKGMGYMAARALGEMGARESAADIAVLLEGENETYQYEAGVALAKLQPLPEEIQAQLDRLLKAHDDIRRAVEIEVPDYQTAGTKQPVKK
ncbi:HEAT repeat domain-containing protein [Gimesia chilikensis]|uniref:HEAT repeat domain-containing protein n=1 Tax=Gimesia chilikensis TaxID=2605989 RepID=UPI0011ED1BAB|nr:HEAT repeat domain-containing protein [Gimesia chilikensis]KAA0137979.1 HEAT repeat domain-containing protein [Gimesia chilikensis]